MATRTRLTLTGDAGRPKVAVLGDGSVLYVYLRGGQLCAQRAVDGTPSGEVLVAYPCDYCDVERAEDGTGVIYFTHDGSLRRMVVDPTVLPVLNGVVFSRQAAWYTLCPTALGEGVVAPFDEVNLHAPTIAAENWLEYPTLTLRVTLPNTTLEINKYISRVWLWRWDSSALGWYRYASAPVADGATEVDFDAPRFTTTPISWAATCYRAKNGDESPLSNSVTDDGNLPVVYLDRAGVVGGIGLAGPFGIVAEYEAPKIGRQDLAPVLLGAGLAGPFDFTTEYSVIKKYTTDSGPVAAGLGLSASWRLNGYDVLNP